MTDRVLDIGCGEHKILPHAVGLDRVLLPGVDVVHDLDQFPYPFPDGSFDQIHARMVIEHLADVPAVMREIRRLLRPGGTLHAVVPYYLSTCAFADPTHRHFFTEKTFSYFTPACALSYEAGAGFAIVEQKLVTKTGSGLERLRSLIPFRWLLRHLLFNMYDEIHVTLKKT